MKQRDFASQAEQVTIWRKELTMKNATYKLAMAAGISAVFVASFAPIPAHACSEDDFSHKTVQGIHYTIRDCQFEHAARVDYPVKASIKHVKIPRYIKHHGRKIPVNQIKKRAFAKCGNIKTFRIDAHIPWRNFGRGCFAFRSDRPIKWTVCKYTTKQLDHFM